MKYTITTFAENRPGILYRIADLFLRRKINIESLTVCETERKGFSRFTIVVDADKNIVEKITKQLYRIIEVTKVYENEDKDLIFKEIALIKVCTKDMSDRNEIKNIVKFFKANIVHVAKDYIIVEKTGSEEETLYLYDLLKQFGIKEFVRSGRIAVLK